MYFFIWQHWDFTTIILLIYLCISLIMYVFVLLYWELTSGAQMFYHLKYGANSFAFLFVFQIGSPIFDWAVLKL
jgi:hypothetical protein